MKSLLKLVLALLMIAGGFSAAMGQEEKPVPGKEVLQKITVPASTSIWDEAKGVDQLGEYSPADTTQEETLSYWLFLPTCESAKSEKGFPLLLFLHGAGERGSNPDAVKAHGPPMLVETEKGATWPFITVSPQTPDGQYWSPDQLFILLDQIAKDYPVDTTRVYVTGLSMGGYGTWMLLDCAGDRFAAAAPLCGGCDVAKAPKMVDIPVWAFHGDADGAVPVERTDEIVHAVRKAGGKKIMRTIYADVGHNCWTQTYDNPELYQWLLSHHK